MKHKRMFTLLVTILFVCPCTRSTTPQTQVQANSHQDSEVVSIRARPVNKQSGLFVDGLRKEDFVIIHHGVKQEIASFSKEECNISVVVLLDISGSMKGSSVYHIKDVATEALNSLNPEDEVALVTYSGKTNIVLELTKDKVIAFVFRDGNPNIL